MEESRESDCRVPFISSIFCICVTTGGVLLVMYVFTPSVSEPWFPIAAFILIGMPWIFWVLAYLYTCMKACCRPSSLDDRQLSRRSPHAPSRTATISNNTMGRNASMNEPSANNSPRDGKHVQFAGVVILDRENSHQEGGDSSVNSSKEIEMPLNSAVSSS